MNKDLSHLMKIVDRFSKIGSETPLTPENINEIVSGSVMYFRTRAPRNVVIDYNGLAIAPVKAQINTALFEWVVENLIKNSLDALQGHGRIDVEISSDDKHVMIDIKDTGKGIPKSNWKRIFEPGFTTKTRGWGLGLSLSRRVIEEYHQGRIASFTPNWAKAPISALPLNATSTDGPATRNTHGFAGRATVRQPADNRNGPSGIHLPAAGFAGDDSPRHPAGDTPRHGRRAVRSRFDTRDRTVSDAIRPSHIRIGPFPRIVLALVFAYLVIIYHNLREVISSVGN